MNFLNRKYKFNRHDDQFDAYLAALGEINILIFVYKILNFSIINLGLNFVSRKIAKNIPSSCELIKIGENEYSFNTILPYKTYQQKFIPGEERDHETTDGRKIKNIFQIEGNKLIEKQIEPNREVIIVREFSEKVLEGTATVNENVKCKMYSDFIDN